MWLIVGLGNPGQKYAGNRHNIGFMVVDALAERWSAPPFRAKFGGDFVPHTFRATQIGLFRPLSFMNLSGRPVREAAQFHKIPPENIIVIHDELDLPPFALHVKAGGGHGGHNGLRSLTAELGSPDFLRIRCGIGRPLGGAHDAVANYVLADFAQREREERDLLIGDAASAVELLLAEGTIAAMNRVNSKKKGPVQK